MEKNSVKLFSKKQSARERRERALERLRAQKKLGKKPVEASGLYNRELVDLQDRDIKRIDREITILESRI